MSSGWGLTTIVSSGAPASPDTRMFMEQRTLSSTDISNKYILLSKPTLDKQETLVTVLDGGDQTYGTDYVVTDAVPSGFNLSWNGLGLDGVLTAGDIIQITYPILVGT